MQCKLIIADDHPLFRTALLRALDQALGNADFIEADCFASVQAAAEANTDADLILLDLQMPGTSGFSGLAYLRGHYPALPVVIISAHDDPKVMHRAIDYGASGFIPKSTALPVLVEALQAVLRGDIWLPPGLPERQQTTPATEHDYTQRLAGLTSQQFRVLGLMTDGLLNKQIADRLDVSEATVKAHVTAVLRKLGVHSRTQAALAFQSVAVMPESLDSA